MKFSSFQICCLLIFLSITGCRNHDILYLEKANLKPNLKIDTDSCYANNNITLVSQREFSSFGNFIDNYYIVKKIKGGDLMAYHIDKSREMWLRSSKNYLFFVKPYKRYNAGWIEVENGIMVTMPGVNDIITNLYNKFPKGCMIRQTNGYISCYKNGKVFKSYNYGNFVTKYKSLNFDSLDYKLYRLTGDSLKVVSGNPDEIFSQQDGVFFIPPPGYGVIAKFNTKQIFQKIDSAYNTKIRPEVININAD